MSFYSYFFLFLFWPLGVIALKRIPQKYKKWCILFMSCLFYWCNSRILVITVAGAALINWIGAGFLFREADGINRKWHLGLMVSINLIPLMLVKYGALLYRDAPEFVTPLGISFYTFTNLSYLFDIYQRKYRPSTDFWTYLSYIFFFPTIVCGPIQRFNDMQSKLEYPVGPSFQIFIRGVIYFLYGLFLKLAIADRIAIITDRVYGNILVCPRILLLVAIIIYSLQIYADFCGYSYMAMGVANTLGIEVTRNFRNPYFSTSITAFWRRWHISLNNWLRDYVYIPLGGNRKGVARNYVNIMIVFLISGIWHGAGGGFLIWGALNGLYQVIEKAFHRHVCVKPEHKSKIQRSILYIFRCVCTYILISISWIFFRAGTLHDSIIVFTQLVHPVNALPFHTFTHEMGRLNAMMIPFMLILPVAVETVSEATGTMFYDKVLEKHDFRLMTAIFVLIILILLFGAYGSSFAGNAFIYAGF